MTGRMTAAAVAATAAAAGCAGTAWAAPGPPGPQVEVHADSTPPGVTGGDASVCVFYLDAVGFPAGGQVRWSIARDGDETGGGAGDGGTPLRADTIALGAAGSGVTENMRLTDGHYALRWAGGGTAGQQAFTAVCGTAAGPPADGADAGHPGSAPDAGGVGAAAAPAAGDDTGRPAGGPPADGAQDGARAVRAAGAPIGDAAGTGAAGEVTAASARRGVLAQASGLAGGLKGMSWAAAALLLAGGLMILPRRRA